FPQIILPGYGWVFPLGDDGANIGVGMRLDQYKTRQASLDTLLQQFLDMIGERISLDTVGEVKSWQLPLASRQYQRVFDGCMLVGDAGRFVDPLLGAGIYAGMKTGYEAGQVAAAALREGDVSARRLSEYDRRWYSDLGRGQRRATLVQRTVI